MVKMVFFSIYTMFAEIVIVPDLFAQLAHKKKQKHRI